MEQIFKIESKVAPGEIEMQQVQPLAYVQTLKPIVFGCAHAFSRQLFRLFGPLPEQVIHEDDVLAFRTALAGQLLFINRVLVKYRVHGNNAYVRVRERGTDLKALARQEDCLRRDFKHRETMYDAFLLDLEKGRLQGLIGTADAAKVAQEASRRHHRAHRMGKFLNGGVIAKWRMLSCLLRDGLNEGERKLLVRHLIPQALLLRLRLIRSFFP
jgi:hypothetical protein